MKITEWAATARIGDVCMGDHAIYGQVAVLRMKASAYVIKLGRREGFQERVRDLKSGFGDPNMDVVPAEFRMK